MWRSIALVVLLAASGCGGVREAAVHAPKHEPCPQGTRFVRARDVVGKPPPSGFELLRGDKAALESFASQFKAPIGKAFRGYDARVLVREGEVDGAAVVVFNINEKSEDDGKGVIRGLEKAGEIRDVQTEPITIAGKEGRMIPAIDGGYIAMAPVGDCAVVALVGSERKFVTDAAAAIPE